MSPCFCIINGHHFEDGNHIDHIIQIRKESSLFTMALLQDRKTTNYMVTLCTFIVVIENVRNIIMAARWCHSFQIEAYIQKRDFDGYIRLDVLSWKTDWSCSQMHYMRGC